MFKTRPDQKGIKTAAVWGRRRCRRVQNQTRSKGDQDSATTLILPPKALFKTRPDQKGIKTHPSSGCPSASRSKPDPIKRGSRRGRLGLAALGLLFKTRPDQKGIKTSRGHGSRRPRGRSKPDPIKRGSRPADSSARHPSSFKTRPDQKGIKTSPSPAPRRHRGFKTRPDQKGIKTNLVGGKVRHLGCSKPDPIKRGSRRPSPPGSPSLERSKPDPIKRGSRPITALGLRA